VKEHALGNRFFQFLFEDRAIMRGAEFGQRNVHFASITFGTSAECAFN
jgi:hypothetical protein